MSSLSDVFVAGLEQVRKSWGWFLVVGILLTLQQPGGLRS